MLLKRTFATKTAREVGKSPGRHKMSMGISGSNTWRYVNVPYSWPYFLGKNATNVVIPIRIHPTNPTIPRGFRRWIFLALPQNCYQQSEQSQQSSQQSSWIIMNHHESLINMNNHFFVHHHFEKTETCHHRSPVTGSRAKTTSQARLRGGRLSGTWLRSGFSMSSYDIYPFVIFMVGLWRWFIGFSAQSWTN